MERRPEAILFEWKSMEESFTTLNKQLLRGNSSSFNESYMFYTKQYFWIELFLEFTLKNKDVL